VRSDDEGTVVFRARLGGPSVLVGQNDESLRRSDAASVLTLIVRMGDLLEVTLGDSRTVLDFDFAGESFYGATCLGGSGDEDGRGCGHRMVAASTDGARRPGPLHSGVPSALSGSK